MVKKAIKGLSLLLLSVLALLLIRTIAYTSKQSKVGLLSSFPEFGNSPAKHLAEAVRYSTISYDETRFDTASMLGFINYLKKTYPLADSLLEKKIINEYSLLYKWKGKDEQAKPIVLMAHMDVVPADSSGHWDYPAFDGMVKDGYVWGRGSMDDKVSVIGILEAVNKLLETGFIPEKTIYLAFGHDEEVGGNKGAKKIAEYLKSQRVKAEYVLDEGLLVTENIVPGISKPVALIGIAEKGYVSIELSVSQAGGHSSMPAKQTPIGILSNAVGKLEQNQLPARISAPVQQFLDHIGPEMPFVQRIAFANSWLMKGIIISKYEASSSGNASVRTTTAPTMFHSGIKDNILPELAKATINFRVLPGETTEDIVEHVRNTIKDERIKINTLGWVNEATPVSSSSSAAYKSIETSIKQIFPEILTAPSLVIASTDSKHYIDIADDVYRFIPVRANAQDLERIHGANERISIDNFNECVHFYYQLIVNSTSSISKQ